MATSKLINKLQNLVKKLRSLVEAGCKNRILDLIDAESQLELALKEEIVGSFEGAVIVKNKLNGLYYPKFSGRFNYKRNTEKLTEWMMYNFGAIERELSYTSSMKVSGRADTIFYSTQLFDFQRTVESKYRYYRFPELNPRIS